MSVGLSHDAQNAFIHNTNTGITSIRPIYIMTAFFEVGTMSSVPYGPASPNVGPMFRNVDAATPNASNSEIATPTSAESTTTKIVNTKKMLWLTKS